MKSIKEFLGWWRSGKEVVISPKLVQIAKFFLASIFVIGAIFLFFYWVSPVPDSIKEAGNIKDPYKYTDEQGKQYAQIVSDEADKRIIEALQDSLKLALRKNGTPFSITQTIYKTDTVIKKVPVYVYTDTGGKRKFRMEHKDNYIYLLAEGDDSTGSFKLQTTDSVTLALSRKNRFFGRDEVIATVINTSPYNVATKMRSVTLKDRKPILSIGPQFGATYSIDKKQMMPYLGIGITFPIITIKK